MSHPRALILEAARTLRKAGVPDASHDAAVLLSLLTGRPALTLRLDADTEISPETDAAYRALVRRRAARVPLQWLTGTQPFLGLEIEVDRNVLIPRPETAMLAERVIDLGRGQPGFRVLDLCCGSGCIGISLAHFLPRANVVLSDISEEALALARENAALNGVRERVSFACGDLLEASLTETGGPLGRFDIICCNPPYIPGAEIGGLMPEVRDHEPRLALDGGEDGLDFYRRLAADLSGRDGKTAPAANAADTAPGDAALPILFLEIGCEQGPAVRRIFEQAGWRRVSVRPDLAGLDRVVVCEP